jgi:hypothetical protein
MGSDAGNGDRFLLRGREVAKEAPTAPTPTARPARSDGDPFAILHAAAHDDDHESWSNLPCPA